MKKTKINLLITKYKMFRMEKDETVKNIEIRFTSLVNSLKALGKKFEDSELVRKIIRSLLSEWTLEVTAI